MSFGEIILAIGPALGFALGVGLFRRGSTSLGAAVAVACICIVVVAAALGNTRPIVGLFAFAMLAAAFVADEKQRRVAAISCFSAAFLALIVAAMHT